MIDAALTGVNVLDFSTLLPGPLATKLLYDAGAQVIKVERPGTGDDLRHYPPMQDGTSVSFQQLNGGKQSITVDLKDPAAIDMLKPLIKEADILVEQFRPGVMDRLGLSFQDVCEINSSIVYCSITGYGQSGPNEQKAGHDLNYLAESGMLSITGDGTGKPSIPPGLIADIGGGAYPAVINILMALRKAEKKGQASHLDISMIDNLRPWMWWAEAELMATGNAPGMGENLLSGGSPRYQIYPTADGRYLAAAPLEEKFWQRFCELIDLDPELRPGDADRIKAIDAVTTIISSKSSTHWQQLFEGEDVCCSIVLDLSEAQGINGKFHPRVPISAKLSRPGGNDPAPELGQHNDDLLD